MIRITAAGICGSDIGAFRGAMAQQVMECSGANAAIRSTLDYVSYAGRITLTGWPKKETSLPTDFFTKKELDICGREPVQGNSRKQ